MYLYTEINLFAKKSLKRFPEQLIKDEVELFTTGPTSYIHLMSAGHQSYAII